MPTRTSWTCCKARPKRREPPDRLRGARKGPIADAVMFLCAAPGSRRSRSRCRWLLLAPVLAAACAWTDPREHLARLAVPYTADAFVAQAGEGDRTAAELFLASCMPADVKDKDGMTALTSAAAGGHLAVVNLLLKKGANPNPPSPEGMTPLTAASWIGRADIVDALAAR